MIVEVGERLAERAAGQDFRARLVEPGTQRRQYRKAFHLPHRVAFIGRLLPDPALDGVERLNEAERLERAARLRRRFCGKLVQIELETLQHIDKTPPRVRPTEQARQSLLGDHRVVTGMPVGVKRAGEAREQTFGTSWARVGS